MARRGGVAAAARADACASRTAASSSYHYVHALRELFGLDPAPREEAPAAEVTRLDARRRAAA